MNPRPTCEEVRLLAPEVALGIASGDERARFLAHANSCADCRRLMEELSNSADALLLLGPLRDPPSGFESSVLTRMRSKRSKGIRSKLVAAGLASVLVTGAAAFWITSDDRRVADHYRHALAEADGTYFGVVPLRTSSGARGGHIFAYEGHPSWMFMVFDSSLEPGRYECELETTTGAFNSLGSFEVGPDDATWGQELPGRLEDVRSVRVLDAQGVVALEATFHSQ